MARRTATPPCYGRGARESTLHASSDPHAPNRLVVQVLAGPVDAIAVDVVEEAVRRQGFQFAPSGTAGGDLLSGDGFQIGRVRWNVRRGLAHPAEVKAALAQTWDWPEAPDAVQTTKDTVVIEADLDLARTRAIGLKAVQAVVQAIVARVSATAIHWMPSERLVPPALFLDSLEHGGAPVDHAINVRLFRITGGRPGEGLMDTRGLSAFGLPDLECHFHGLDLGLVARLLFAYGEYLFDKGDVLGDESMVRGTQSHEEWECQRGTSTMGPPRPVVRLLPDPANRPA